MVHVASKSVGETGLGLMGLTTNADAQIPDSQGFLALKKSLELGANFWNSGDFYGRPEPTLNLQFLSRYFTKYPEDADKVYLSVKGGVRNGAPSASPEAIDNSFKRILAHLDGKKHLDMFCLARVNNEVPIEESVRAIVKHIEAGHVDSICLSEVAASTIRRAHKVHPIAAVELEFSLWSREAEENGVFATCAELGIPVIAYSPLGRGFLTGRFQSRSQVPQGDFKLTLDRFSDENMEKNRVLLDQVSAIAKLNNVSNAQVALQWVRNHSNKPGYPTIIPIPGATTTERVAENSVDIAISDDNWRQLDDFLKSFSVSGYRYTKEMEGTLYQ
jgi:pyridoxine 4-dehydrogenase